MCKDARGSVGMGEANPTLSAQNNKEEKSKFTHREFILFILCKDTRGSVGMGEANPTLSAQNKNIGIR